MNKNLFYQVISGSKQPLFVKFLVLSIHRVSKIIFLLQNIEICSKTPLILFTTTADYNLPILGVCGFSKFQDGYAKFLPFFVDKVGLDQISVWNKSKISLAKIQKTWKNMVCLVEYSIFRDSVPKPQLRKYTDSFKILISV